MYLVAAGARAAAYATLGEGKLAHLGVSVEHEAYQGLPQ